MQPWGYPARWSRARQCRIADAVRKRRCGLSTIELLLVVALLGIAAGLTLPRFGGRLLPYEDVATTSQSLVNHLRLARRLAVSERRDHRLRFSPSTAPYASYTLQERDGNWDDVRGPYAIPDSVACSGDRNHEFTELGAATASTVIVLSRNAESRTLRVLAATGRCWEEP